MGVFSFSLYALSPIFLLTIQLHYVHYENTTVILPKRTFPSKAKMQFYHLTRTTKSSKNVGLFLCEKKSFFDDFCHQIKNVVFDFSKDQISLLFLQYFNEGTC